MAKNYTMWTHGTSVQHQEDSDDIKLLRDGIGTTVRQLARGRLVWFQFTIPTPAVVSDKRLRIARVLLDFQTSAYYTVHFVDVWDGHQRIAQHPNLALRGVAQDTHFSEKFDIPQHPEVSRGICISVGVQTSPDILPAGAQIIFISAGAVFYLPEVVEQAPD